VQHTCQVQGSLQQGNVKVSAELLQTTKFTKNTKEQLTENKIIFLQNLFFVLSVFFVVISNVNPTQYGEI